MNNKTFYNLLHDVKDDAGKRPRWTLEKIAAELFCNRNYLNDVINNKVTGTNIRKRVIDFFEKQFEPWRVKRMLEALGWSMRTATDPIADSQKFRGRGRERG